MAALERAAPVQSMQPHLIERRNDVRQRATILFVGRRT
jgi:hypothetical protein